MDSWKYERALKQYAEIVLARNLEAGEDANSEFAFEVLCFLATHQAASVVNSSRNTKKSECCKSFPVSPAQARSFI
jgi:hypothetical protein